MKSILILSLLNIFLYAEISCKNKLETTSIYEFGILPNSSILAVVGELEDGFIYGDIDPANSPIPYYDNRSAICGGKEDFNKLVIAYCPYDIDICWDITLGSSGYQTIVKKDGKFTNNVIVADTYPCLPYNTQKVTVAFYDYDNNDIGFADFNLLAIEEEIITNLTKEEAINQRNSCPNLLSYIDELENIATNQNLALQTTLTNVNTLNLDNTNQLLTNLNYTLSTLELKKDQEPINDDDSEVILSNFNINPNIDNEINTFKNNLESKINTSFNSYSEFFGFGNYGLAPDPINLNLFGRSYTILDIQMFNDQIPMIRNVFISFAYAWGCILVFRDLA